MTRKELLDRIYGDYYKSEEERNAFIRDYLRNYKAPPVKLSQAEVSQRVEDIFRKAQQDQIKRNAMRALAMDRALHTRTSI